MITLAKPYVTLKYIGFDTVEVWIVNEQHPHEKIVGHYVIADVHFPELNVVVEAKLRYPAVRGYEISEQSVMQRIREVFRIDEN